MRIVLHLGAHKTATTYIQTVLGRNADRLRERKVGFVDLERMRLAVTPLVDRPAMDLGSAPRALVDSHRDCERVILSDENIPGLCSNAIKAGTYYARLRRRAGGLVRALEARDVQILFAVRSYDTFVSSMYCEYLLHRPFLTITEYLDAVDVEGFSWKTIVATLVDLVGEDRVTIWRYEDFPRIEDDVFAAFCGDAAEGLDKPREMVRISHSQRAIEALAALLHELHREEIQLRVPIVSAAMPKQADNPAFNAFEANAAAALRDRYQRDFADIREAFPAMTVLSEPVAPPDQDRPPVGSDEAWTPDRGRSRLARTGHG